MVLLTLHTFNSLLLTWGTSLHHHVSYMSSLLIPIHWTPLPPPSHLINVVYRVRVPLVLRNCGTLPRKQTYSLLSTSAWWLSSAWEPSHFSWHLEAINFSVSSVSYNLGHIMDPITWDCFTSDTFRWEFFSPIITSFSSALTELLSTHHIWTSASQGQSLYSSPVSLFLSSLFPTQLVCHDPSLQPLSLASQSSCPSWAW